MDRHGINAKVLRASGDPNGDFCAVCDEQFLDHAALLTCFSAIEY
jgi:hypothetical protein